MKYLVHYTGALNPKNKLQVVVWEYLKSFNRNLIKSEDLEDFKDGILTDIIVYNDQYPRCNPVKARWCQRRHSGRDTDHSLWVGINDTSDVKFTLLFGKEDGL